MLIDFSVALYKAIDLYENKQYDDFPDAHPPIKQEMSAVVH